MNIQNEFYYNSYPTSYIILLYCSIIKIQFKLKQI
ncbi:hypothetical protein [Plasmodium yoelii yoelii]|uniref:Uncharacterized protein n=1 Tax=Plasmodium yoelii yoelii TaxID=73239 RepID=Q7RTD8_PLAYO|nr:hypothetical protein [Plasmodium yoelii yoelii]